MVNYNDSNQQINVCFDEDSKIRVLETDKIKHTQELEHECIEFATKMDEFHSIVTNVSELMENQAKRIEIQKLRAIGQRNRMDSEIENRQRQKQMLQALISEKMIEFERYNQQYQSLLKVDAGQTLLIERLSNNEA